MRQVEVRGLNGWDFFCSDTPLDEKSADWGCSPRGYRWDYVKERN